IDMNSSSRARVTGSARPASQDSMPSRRWNFDAWLGWIGTRARSPAGGLHHSAVPLSGTAWARFVGARSSGRGAETDRATGAEQTRDRAGRGAHRRAEKPWLGVLLGDDDGQRRHDAVVGAEDRCRDADEGLWRAPPEGGQPVAADLRQRAAQR